MKFVHAYITTENKAEAKKIGKKLVELKLAACVNVIDGMESIYWWEGKIEEASEAILIAKTRESLADALTSEVKKLHSYSCPCVLILPVSGGNEQYLSWLADNTRE